MALTDSIRNKIIDWLKIKPSTSGAVTIDGSYDHQTTVFIDKIWLRGDAKELSQLHHQLDIGEETFWGASCSPGQDMRKIHTGIPSLMVNMLCNISIDDMSDIIFDDEPTADLWKKIEKDNKLHSLLKTATKNALALGDGAFKLSFDEAISPYPIIEFYAADDVRIKTNRGRVREIEFITRYEEKKRTYTLVECYGYGYIKYKLFNEYNSQVPLTLLEETADLQDVEFDKSVMFAVPYIIYESEKFSGRGRSIFTGKYDSFDALDEAFSQWVDALRSGKTKTYIPECLLRRDPASGAIQRPNSFDSKFIAIGTDISENSHNQITTVGGNLQVDAYVQTYSTALDLCLQGIVSPSSLGIDVKKLDNGEAQREKEKATLYTRAAILASATEVIHELIKKSFYMLQLQNGQKLTEIDGSFSFGEYANPSFESVVETMSNPNSPLSIEAKVEEIWGDSKEQNWKDEEVSRIKNERGIITLDEPVMIPNE